MDENEVLNVSRSQEIEDATSNAKMIPIHRGIRLYVIQLHFVLQVNPLEFNKIFNLF